MTNELPPDVRRAFRWLAIAIVAIELLLMLSNLLEWPAVFYKEGHTPLLGMDDEANLPTWLSTILLYSAGLAALAAWWVERDAGGPEYTPLQTAGWLVLTALFVWLSLDEAATIHENTGAFLFPEQRERFRQGGWVFLFLPFFLLAGGFMARFLWIRFRGHMRQMVLLGAGFAFWGAALLLEVSGKSEAVVELHDRSAYSYRISMVAEEGSEMFGSTCFLFAIAGYAALRRRTSTTSPPSG